MKSKYFSIILVLFIWLAAILSFLHNHLTNDFYVFWGWAKQVTISSESGLGAMISTWEMKGLLSRFIYYLLYIITNSFNNEFNTAGQFIYKLIALAFVNTILLISFLILPKEFFYNNVKKIKYYFISSFFLSAVHFSAHLQPEFFSIFFLIISLSLYLKNHIFYKILGGIIFSLTFYLKSPILIMGGTVYFSILLLKKQNFFKELKHFLPFLLSSFVFLTLSLFYLHKFYPQELRDIVDASHFQHTLLSNPLELPLSLFKSINSFRLHIWNFPIVLLGSVISIAAIISLLKDRNYQNIIYICGLWIFPFLYISISNCFFIYHYFLLTFPCLIVTYLYKNKLNDALNIPNILIIILTLIVSIFLAKHNISFLLNKPQFWVTLSLAIFSLSLINKLHIFIIRFCLILICFVFITSYSSFSYNIRLGNKLYDEWLKKERIEISKIPNLSNKRMPILFLDDGIGAFLFDNKSYLRHFYPLPIQRIDEENSVFVNSTTFKNTIHDLLNYNGEYITINYSWFFNFKHTNIENKINEKWKVWKEIRYLNFSWELYPNYPVTYTTILLYRKH